MKTISILALTLLISCQLFAQTRTLTGEVIDPSGNPLQFATVALMHPSDSTLAYFCITNTKGQFELKQVKDGSYYLQIAFIGYKTLYRDFSVPDNNGDHLGTLLLVPTAYDMGEARVTGERIPILIRQDTVEYNASAFKTKPDAVAEDLLRKLPGLEVDRSGNVKAIGENVNRVLVDGKEFFGNDPKMATKNLPAESIDKVQVYDKKTDEAELLGIDDSEYDKTINFVLKEDMKKAIFGDVAAGAGTDEFYQTRAKIYRFTDRHQFAAIGMLNNVNKPGFSFQDYLDFNGGMRSIMGSGGGGTSIAIHGNDNLPVDFGRPVTGFLTSGAGGLNYSYEPAKNNRINISYMANGSRKTENEKTYSRLFTNDNAFEQESTENAHGSNFNQLLNLGWRNKASRKQHFMLNGIIGISENNSVSNSATKNLLDELPLSALTGETTGRSDQLNGSAEGSWLRKGEGAWKMLKINNQLRYSRTLKKSEWNTLSSFFDPEQLLEDAQYLENTNSLLENSIRINSMLRLGKAWYFEPELSAGISVEEIIQDQGNSTPRIQIDSVSPMLEKSYQYLRPGIGLKKYSRKTKIGIGMNMETGQLLNSLEDSVNIQYGIFRILPFANWEYEYKTGRRIMINYSSSSRVPDVYQLLPIISNSNPLAVLYGNRKLKPEELHELYLSWFLFDQFSFTSLFTSLSGSYTRDKINRSIRISEDLKQTVRLANVPDDYQLAANIDFSTPIRPLGIKINLGFNEKWNKGLSWVNDIPNTNINKTHRASLRFDNRKKEKWDVEIGGNLSYTQAEYSIQKELNTDYFSYSGFGEIRFTPTDKWHFMITGDITSYNAQSFKKAITIPLLSAGINYYFLKNKRAMLTLEATDLMNKNTGLSRISELNYLREVRSATIGRYFMISLKYKLNQFGSENSGITIKTGR
ncbi:MAG: TonB-dependent receptor [Bacteroidales bacterium]